MYKSIEGDTFDSIARKMLGTDTKAAEIQQANPGVIEPMPAGVTIQVPGISEPGAGAITDDPDETTLDIAGVNYQYWQTIVISKSMDAIPRVGFTSPYDPTSEAFRTTFRPFSFQLARVHVGSSLEFTGRMITPRTQSDPNRKSMSVELHGLPAVLQDCSLPASAFPAQFKNQNLQQISEICAAPFGLTVATESDPGAAFEKIDIKPGQKILPWLSGLSKQRALVYSSNTAGQLVLWNSTPTGDPVARLEEGFSPLIKLTPQWNTSQYYSSITARKPTKAGSKGASYTIENPFLATMVRPYDFTANDTTGGDPKLAAEAKLGRMLGNMVSYQADVCTWRDYQENLWRENTTITVQYPSVEVYEPYEFLIRAVTFFRNGDQKTARLTLCMPGAFSGEIPERLPWD